MTADVDTKIRNSEMKDFTPCTIEDADLGLAMNLLSRNYSMFFDAVVREITVNALDSHREAGTRTKVRVQLPTVEDPRFIVTDHGTGLSPDEVIEVTGKYLKSTKREDADATGFYGLGLKAPYTLTDQFSMTTVKDGKKATTLFASSESLVPHFNQVSIVDTNETNGVTVTIPASVNDIEKWNAAAARVMAWMDPEALECPQLDEAVIGSWDTGRDTATSTYQVSYIDRPKTRQIIGRFVQMGPIAYRVPDHVAQKIGMIEGAVIHVPNKSAGIAHSRETIEDTESNVKMLGKIYRQWVEHLQNTFMNAAMNAQTQTQVYRIFDQVPHLLLTTVFGFRLPYQFLMFTWIDNRRNRVRPGIHQPHVIQYKGFGRRKRDALWADTAYQAITDGYAIEGPLDEKQLALIPSWRHSVKTEGQVPPTVIIVDKDQDLGNVTSAEELNWISIDEVARQAPRPPKKKRTGPAVLDVVTRIAFRRGEPKPVVDGESVLDLRQRIDDDTLVIADTNSNLVEWLRTTQHAVHHSDNVVISKGSRSIERISEMLDAEVITAEQYWQLLRSRAVASMTAKTRKMIADELIVPFSPTWNIAHSSPAWKLPEDADKDAQNVVDYINEVSTATFDVVFHVVDDEVVGSSKMRPNPQTVDQGSWIVFDQFELRKDPSMPKSWISEQFPMTAEVIRGRSTSPELLQLVLDHDLKNR